jgi:hypothetical protein
MEAIGGLFVVIICIGLYFIPFIVASAKMSPRAPAIGALNLFLGWTFLGWVVALVWAMAEAERKP